MATLTPAAIADSSAFVGTLKAKQRATVQSEIAGQIVVGDGDRVEPGQLLLQINPDQTIAQVQASTASVNAGDIINAANQDPALGGSVYTQFTASAPQLRIDRNRDRLKALNVNFSDALSTLSVYLGSRYVNDFTLSQRSYRVYAQADSDFRSNPNQLRQYYTCFN